MIRSFDLPYGDETLAVGTAGVDLTGVYTPRPTPPALAPEALVREALDNPIGSESLRQAARGKASALVLIDDITRETPADLLLPPILDDLEAAGIAAGDILVMIALGTHRPMTDGEIRYKVGDEVLARVRVTQHDHRTAPLRDLGVTPSGTPIEVNEHLFQADIVIGTGAVVPHHIAGFSAGAKIVQPGVSGAATTAATHMFSARARTPLLGRVDTPVRAEMELIAERCGMRQVLNVTLNADGRIVTARFGATRPTFRRAVEDARRIYGVRAPAGLDAVVAGSHPCDIEFWQAHKSLYPAMLMVRPGGTIIVVTPCPEGVAVTHPDMLDYTAQPADELLRRYEGNEIDDRVAASLAVAWARVREYARVVLVSDGIAPHETKALGFDTAPDVETALAALARTSGSAPQVGVLTHAPDTLPLVA